MRKIIILIFLILLYSVVFAQNHFIPVWTGNGFQQMNHFIAAASVNGRQLAANDEIAVFDNTICVGMVKLSGSINPVVQIISSADDPTTVGVDGFTVGHTISYRIWDAETQTEVQSSEITVTVHNATSTYSFGGSSIVSLSAVAQRALSLSVSPANTGTVSGAGNFNIGASVTIEATANDGYHFVNWTKNGVQASTNASYTFTMPNTSVTYVANFVADEYEVHLFVNPENSGTVNGDGTYQYNESVTIEAIPAVGYEFINWTINSRLETREDRVSTPELSTEPVYSFMMPSTDLYYTANFSPLPFTLNLNTEPLDSGTVIGSGTFDYNTSVTIEAIPEDGFVFVSWTNGQTIVSTNASYTFNMPAENITYTAHFTPEEYDVYLFVNPENSGTTTGAGTYDYNESVTIEAIPATGYEFINWTIVLRGEDPRVSTPELSTEPIYTFNMPDHDVYYMANFSLTQHTVNLSVNPENTGRVLGGGTFDYNESVSIEAIPMEGYHFVNWTNGQTIVSTNATYTFNMPDQDLTYTANFAPNQHTVALSIFPESTGSVTGAGNYTYGSSVTINAIPNYGYQFVNWTQGDAIISSNAQYTFTMPDINMSFQANFAPLIRTVTLNVNPVSTGTVLGAGTYEYNESVTIEAIPAQGYEFVNWTNGQSVISTSAIFSFTMPAENINYTANFAPDQFTVYLYDNPDNSGTMLGAGTYDYNELVTIQAIPNNGYEFVNWTELSRNSNLNDRVQSPVVSTEPIYTFNMPSTDLYYVANFSPLEYNLILNVSPANSGSVVGAGPYDFNTSVTIEALPADGYEFVNWTNGQTVVSTDAIFTFNMPAQNLTYTANFAPISNTLSLYVNPENTGTVTGAGDYEFGASVTINAIPHNGYLFVNWTHGDAIISTNPQYTFTMPNNDLYYTANFIPEQHTVSLNVTPANAGTVVGAGTYDFNASVTIEAIANEGYHFTHWSNGAQLISESSYYTFTMGNQDLVYTAHFEPIQYYVTTYANPSEAGSVTPAANHFYTSSVTIEAIPYPGYRFVNWVQDDQIVSTQASYTFTMPNYNVEFTAYFAPLTYDVTLNVAPANTGSVIGAGTYDFNASVSIEAIPADGYEFVNWTNGQVVVSTETCYSFNMPNENLNYTANFAPLANTLSLYVNPEDTGTVTGAGDYDFGASVTINAIPHNGYLFVNWTNGDAIISTNPQYTFTMPNNDLTYTANFVPEQHTVILNVNPANTGTVIGAGTYDFNSSVTIEALPADGYEFVNWTIGQAIVSVDAQYTFDMPAQDLIFTANFAPVSNTLTLYINPENTGTVTGAGDYDFGASVTINAIPHKGYLFVNWTHGDVIISTNPQYTFTMPNNDLYYTANFIPEQHSVSLNVTPANAGTVVGAGPYDFNASVTIEAIANEGYYFTHWSNGIETISDLSYYTFTMGNQDVVYTAHFEPIQYYVTTYANPSEAGSVTPAANHYYTSSVTIEAIPYPGYRFVNWVQDDQIVSSEAIYTFTMPNYNVEFTANFAPLMYDVTLNVNPANTGTVIGAGTYDFNAPVSIEAIPADGYEFVNWTYGQVVVSTETCYSFNMPNENLNYTANFAPLSNTLSLAVNPENTGTVTGAGDYDFGASVTINAIPHNGYLFVNWTHGDAIISTDAQYTFTMPNNDLYYTANFMPEQHTVSLTVTPANAGTVLGAGTYDFNSLVTIEALPAEGYEFVNWTNGQVVVSTEASYSFNMPNENLNYTANFAPLSNTLSLAVNPENTGTVTGAGDYDFGASVTINAMPHNGYLFVNWTHGDAIISTNPQYTFTMPNNDLTYTANFVPEQHMVSLNVNPANAGTVVGAGPYDFNSLVTIEALPADGYEFVNWTNGQAIVSSMAIYTFSMPNQDLAYTANFAPLSNTLSLNVNPENTGTVTGAGDYDFGASVTINAMPHNGYLFVNWTHGDAIISTNAQYTFTMPNNDLTYTANFMPEQHVVSLNVNPANAGTVVGAGSYDFNSSVTIEALPADGYEFVNWTNGQVIVSQMAIYTFSMPNQDLAYTANFAPIGHTLTLNVSPVNSGTVTGAGSYISGASVTINAIPNNGYQFVNWTSGDAIISTNALYTFVMPNNDLAYTANFSPVFNPPLNLSAEAGDMVVHLTWEAPEAMRVYVGNSSKKDDSRALTGYIIYRDNIPLNTIVTTLSYSDTSVINGTNYTYYVVAQYNDPDGQSDPSNSVNATPIHIDVMLPPSNLTAVPGNAYVTLDWDGPANRALYGYNVYRNNQLIAENVVATNYSDTTVVPAEYAYHVTALYNEPAGESSASNTINVTAYVNPPRDLSVIELNESVVLNWNYPLNPTPRLAGFKVMRDNQLITEVALADTSFTDTGLTNGTAYTYKVFAIYANPNCESGYSNTVTATPHVINNDIIETESKTGITAMYPNPFNPVINISFNISKSANVHIDIYNVKGTKVKTLIQSYYSVGSYHVSWNGCDDSNQACASGIYFVKMSTDQISETKKIIMLK